MPRLRPGAASPLAASRTGSVPGYRSCGARWRIEVAKREFIAAEQFVRVSGSARSICPCCFGAPRSRVGGSAPGGVRAVLARVSSAESRYRRSGRLASSGADAAGINVGSLGVANSNRAEAVHGAITYAAWLSIAALARAGLGGGGIGNPLQIVIYRRANGSSEHAGAALSRDFLSTASACGSGRAVSVGRRVMDRRYEALAG